MRTLTLSLICLLVTLGAMAQDKIYKTDGSVIDGKVKTVGTRTIAYQRGDNASGPEYTIPKNEVTKIVYQNGTTDSFERDWRPTHHRRGHGKDEAGGDAKDYGPNLLAIAPIQFTDNGLGFSISYMRALDKKGIVAVYLPVIATANLNSHTYYDYNSGTYVNGHSDKMYYFMPGVQIFPTGSYGIVRYSIGPSLVVATGEKTQEVYSSVNPGYTDHVTYNHTLVGMILNNTLNINPNPRLYLGIELGLGFSYYNRVNGLNDGSKALAQGGLRLGYRF